jgi:hypothetical protein
VSGRATLLNPAERNESCKHQPRTNLPTPTSMPCASSFLTGGRSHRAYGQVDVRVALRSWFRCTMGSSGFGRDRRPRIDQAQPLLISTPSSTPVNVVRDRRRRLIETNENEPGSASNADLSPHTCIHPTTTGMDSRVGRDRFRLRGAAFAHNKKGAFETGSPWFRVWPRYTQHFSPGDTYADRGGNV